jgi:UDP-N-acetylglucosamine 3-dehydrogenase
VDPVRIAVIGLGMMGRNHVRVLRALNEAELVAVFDPLGDPLGSAVGVRSCASLDELLSVGLEAAVVATPTDDHVSIAVQLASAGVAALIEKPLAVDVAGGTEVVRAFADAGVVGSVGHIERCNAAIRALHDRLAAGELGDLYQVSTSRQGPFPDRVRDVGVIKDLATHDIDLTAWVAGQDYRSVAARTAHRAGRPHEDLVAVVGDLMDGTVTNHLVNWLTPTKDRRIVVTGERGSFVADTLTADLTFFANASVPSEWDAISKFRGVSEGDMIRFALPKPEPLRVELEAFCEAVRGLRPPLVPLTDGLATLRVADAVALSARDGAVVQVAHP